MNGMEKNKMNKLIIYTDGGARGNPGPAAIGFVIGTHADGGAGKEYSEYISETTNNVAEYKAVIFALKKAKSLLGGNKAKQAEVEVRSDSELLVSQMNGSYKIKEESLKMLFVDVWNLKTEFKGVSFAHIPREKNSRADALVNRELDSRLF